MTRKIKYQPTHSMVKAKYQGNNLLNRGISQTPRTKEEHEKMGILEAGNTFHFQQNFSTLPLQVMMPQALERQSHTHPDSQLIEKSLFRADKRENKVLQRMEQIEEEGFTPPPPPPNEGFEESAKKFDKKIAEQDEIIYKNCLKEGKKRYEELINKTQKKRIEKEELDQQWEKYSHKEEDKPEYAMDEKTSIMIGEGGEYENVIRAEQGIIEAHSTRKGKEKISPSDVLFKQFELKGGKNLQILKRMNVASETGNAVLRHLHRTYEKKTMDKEAITEEKGNLFYAICGLVNCTAAIYLIGQRGIELGIAGIEKFEYHANETQIWIYFKPL
jgi:hypothetical protein